MPEFEVSGLSARSGEKVKGYIGEVMLGDGSRVGLPAIIANGVEDGPTLLLIAGVHGTEVVGCAAVIEAMRAIEPRELRGRVVAVTASNPLALRDTAYETPYDHINLSTPLFKEPKPGGVLTERLADIVMRAADQATNMIDMHANPDPSIPFVLYNSHLCRDEATRQATVRLAESFGVTAIDSGGDPSAAQRDIRYSKGLTTMTAELTGNMFIRQESVDVGKTGVLNVMRALEMIPGTPAPQPGKKIDGDFVAAGRLITSRGGLLWIRKQPGTFIASGEVVAEIRDLWGDILEELTMPVDGYCWAFGGRPGTSHIVAEGTAVNYIFKPRE